MANQNKASKPREDPGRGDERDIDADAPAVGLSAIQEEEDEEEEGPPPVHNLNGLDPLQLEVANCAHGKVGVRLATQCGFPPRLTYFKWCTVAFKTTIDEFLQKGFAEVAGKSIPTTLSYGIS